MPPPITPAQAASRCRAALRQGHRLWASGDTSGEIDAIRLHQGRLEGRWRYFPRWEAVHTVWRWSDDEQEDILYDTP